MTTSKVFVSRKLLPRFLFRILTLNKVKLLKNKVYFLQRLITRKLTFLKRVNVRVQLKERLIYFGR